jgi:CheY-like chemotaxis protein
MEQKIILLADDDRDDIEMFCEALEEIDNTVTCYWTINGEELLNKIHELNDKPNLIFLDVNMPIMDGWDCLKTLKANKRYSDIPVIMISTSSHKEDMDAAISLGALCYFVKPNTYNELKSILEVVTTNLESGLKDAIANLKAEGYTNIFI